MSTVDVRSYPTRVTIAVKGTQGRPGDVTPELEALREQVVQAADGVAESAQAAAQAAGAASDAAAQAAEARASAEMYANETAVDAANAAASAAEAAEYGFPDAPDDGAAYVRINSEWRQLYAPLAVTGELMDGVVGEPYAGSLSVTGGLPPYTLGDYVLPPGLTAALGGATINVTGTPTEEWDSEAAINVGDSFGSVLGSVFDVRVAGEVAPFMPDAAFFSGSVGAAYDLTTAALVAQSGAGTTPVIALGDPIGYAEDISGNGNHATQAIAANRLVWLSGGKCTDSTDKLVSPLIDFSGTDKITIIALIETQNTDSSNIVSTGGGTAAGDWILGINSAQQSYVAGIGGSPWSGAKVALSAMPATPHTRVVTAELDRAGASTAAEVAIRLNSDAVATEVISAGNQSGNFTANKAIHLGGAFTGGTIKRVIVIGRLLSELDRTKAAQWAADPAGIVILSDIPPAGLAGIEGLHSYGQSLSIGTSSRPVLSTSARFGDYMFDAVRPGVYTALNPLVETLNDPSDLGETPCSGAAEILHEQSGFTGKFLAFANGLGEQTIAQLGPGSLRYNGALAVVAAARLRARALSQYYKLRAFFWMQGESDGANPDYAAALASLRGSFNADYKAITKQSEDVWCITYQLARPRIGLEHLRASDTMAGIRVAMPMYQLQTTDLTHLTNISSKVAGAYFGLAYKALILDGNTNWQPLKCIDSNVSSNVLELTFNPVGSLVFDTTIVSAQTNQGFRLFQPDGTTAITISSVSISGGNVVRITASGAIPAGAIVRYGFSDPGGTAPGTAKGNLRDSQGDTIVFDGGGLNYPMHNWCVLFQRSL